MKQITLQEEKWSNELGSHRAKEFKITRSYVRYVLSDLFGISPLDVPLKAPPGKAPKLDPGFGYVSFSHCKNALLIGWSPKNIGVDIESFHRTFKANEVAKRYFTYEENKILSKIDTKDLKDAVLENWVVKEAAIKWQRGSIYLDLPKWEWRREKGFAIHKKYERKVNIYLIKFGNWAIAIANEEKIKKAFPLICVE